MSSLGTATGYVSSGDVAVAAATAVPAGDTLIVEIAATPSAVATVTDDRGNVYTQDANAVNAGNVSTWIFSAPVVNALSAGDHVVVHFQAAAPAAEAISVLQVNGLAVSDSLDKVHTGVGAGTSADSGVTGETHDANELLIGAIGVQGPGSDTFAPGSGYSLVGRAGADAGPSVTVNPEFRTVNAIGQYHADGALGASRNWAAAIATYAIETGTANEQFISQVYLDFLHRPVDASGLAYWDAQLAAGESRQDVVYSIEQTMEFANVTVEGLYQRYLHRAADPGGLSNFSNELLQGQTIEQVSASIAGSQEFYVAQGGGTNSGFLNALYQDALGRPIDPFALSWWQVNMAFGASPEQVARVVLNTPEYNRDVVQQAYQDLLGRDADPLAVAHWVSVLTFGGTDQYVYSRIAGSQEYFDKSQT
ncbi:MAG TPA: DUF4214 domain-containing protein [Pirellulales bacterium]|nr:DUF4214 domain-containing protein [Pirellulales bacterium]